MHPRKDWHTLNEDTLQRAAAAWVWMNTYIEGRGVSLPAETRIGDAVLSKLAPPCAILRQNVEGGQTLASMGNRTWGALGLPLQTVTDNGEDYFSFGTARVALTWFHITAPQQWDVLPFVAFRHEVHGVIMKPTGPPEPLVKHIFNTKNSNMLTDEDLKKIVDHLPVALPSDPTVESLISLLAAFYGCDAAAWLAKFNDTGGGRAQLSRGRSLRGGVRRSQS